MPCIWMFGRVVLEKVDFVHEWPLFGSFVFFVHSWFVYCEVASVLFKERETSFPPMDGALPCWKAAGDRPDDNDNK